MIKVLEKTFNILELIAGHSPKAVSLANISEVLGLNKATCSRIIKDLTDNGYLTQVSRSEGFTVGPKAFCFKGQVVYKERFLRIIEPLIEECARKTEQSVLFAEMHNFERYILCHYNYNSTFPINLNKVSYTDFYETATGIVLLSYLDKGELVKYIEKNDPVAGGYWGEASGVEQFIEELDSVREKKIIIKETYASGLCAVAVPVFENNKFIGAVGISVRGDDFSGKCRDNAIAEIKFTADKITEAVSSNTSIG
jgi:DNA-binding IclR family transcriptional regulator